MQTPQGGPAAGGVVDQQTGLSQRDQQVRLMVPSNLMHKLTVHNAFIIINCFHLKHIFIIKSNLARVFLKFSNLIFCIVFATD